MVKIRLRRDGAKKAPYYTMVVADSRYPMDGRFIEKVGTYNPMTEPKQINLDADKIKEWIKKGAKPTDTAKALIEKAGINLKEV
ncbi:MAG: 30S ribosomal protein S16 [Clostridia bacterium]|nr:30S ribosomal protein S16 [Clostridia bacterium]